MNLFDEFFAITEQLETRGVPYALIGGIALAFHDVPRFTRDIDLLIRPADVDRVKHIFETLGYFESAEPWTFQKTNATLYRFMKTEQQDHLLVDVVAGHESRHHEIIDRVVVDESRSGPVRIARKEDIIWLKRFRNSDQDQVDIKRLSDDEN
ncbi:MAG: nucleotidyl transferase AbiEii/AbiGii toxin family protein [Planctomycetaceae bacterium]